MRTFFLFASLFATTPAFADWPQWRGPTRDGVLADAPAEWPEKLTEVWKVEVGQGHAGPVVAGDLVLTLTRVGDDEVVRAVKKSDGKTMWSQKYKASAELDGAVGWHGQIPRSTPLIADGRVYTFSVHGVLNCWEAATGKPIWRKSFEKQFPKPWPLYGSSTSPIAFDGKVIVWVGGHDKGAFSAFDARSGVEAWSLPLDGPGYASPVVADIAGSKQLITQSQKFLLGVDPKTGKELWKQKFTTGYDQNSVTPVVWKDAVIYSGYQRAILATTVAKSGATLKPSQRWELREHACYMSTPVIASGRLIALSMADGGTLVAVDPSDGTLHWKSPGKVGEYAALISAGEHVLVQTDAGKLLVIKANADKFAVVREYAVSTGKTWAHPAVTSGLVFIKDADHLTCWRVK